MFRLRRLCIDTMREHVIFVHEAAVAAGELGFNPVDRVRLVGTHPGDGTRHELTGTLNFCGTR